MQSDKIKKSNRIWFLALFAAVLAVGIFLGFKSTSKAVVDETNALTFAQVEGKMGEIPECFIFTGTHLMHIDGITDALYEKAVDSGRECGQTRIYYRSELSGGSWYQVEGTGIDEIYKEGRPVKKTVINPLYVQYFTGSDGITKDVMTMFDVGPFDIPDPYSLYNLPELDPLRKVYEGTVADEAEGGNESAVFMQEKIKAFFNLNVHTQETDRCDEFLKKLQPLHDSYKDAGDNDRADTVFGLMERVDARRRFLVFEQLLQKENESYQLSLPVPYGEDAKTLDALFNQLTGLSYSGNTPYSRMEAAETGCDSSITNCQNSRAKHEANMLKDGSNVRTRGRHRADLQVLDKLNDGSVTELMAIESIINDDIKDKETELLSLDSKSGEYNKKTLGFIAEASAITEDELKGGAGEEYITAEKNGESEAALQGRIQDRKNTVLTPCIEELQTLIIAKKERVTLEDALLYVYDRYKTALGWEDIIKQDPYYNTAKLALKDHEQWLLDLAAQIQDELNSQNGDLDNLDDEMEDLNKKREDAYNDDNPKDGKKYDAMIDALADVIDNEKNKKGKGGDGSDKNKALDNIKNDGLPKDGSGGDGDGSEGSGGDGSGGLGGNADAALDMLSNLGDTAGTQELADSLSDADKDKGDDAKDKADKNSGKNDSGYLSPEDIGNILASILGGPFESLDAKGKIIAAVAVGEFADGYSPARQMSVNFMNICIKENNVYAFSKIKDSSTTGLFSSIKALAAASGYRYEFTNNRHTLSKHARYFSCTPGSDELTGDGGTSKLKETVREWSHMGEMLPYIFQEDIKASFNCDVYYVKETDYGACFSQEMTSKKEKLVNALKEALEESKG